MLRIPSEPSVIGIMVLSFLAGILIGGFSMDYFLGLSLIAFTIHLLTFSHIQDIFRARGFRYLPLPLTLNTIPYILGMALGRQSILLPMVIGGGVFTTYSILVYRHGYRYYPAILVGTLLITTQFLVAKGFNSIDGIILVEDVLIWIYLAGYYTSTAYYVESRLVFRDVPPINPFILWIASSTPIVIYIYSLIPSYIEPTVKHLANIFRNVKYSGAREIRRMGWIEMVRSLIFTILLITGYRLIG